MEVLNVTLDLQGTRVHGIGGMICFNEEWMKNDKIINHNLLVTINGDNSKKSQNNACTE